MLGVLWRAADQNAGEICGREVHLRRADRAFHYACDCAVIAGLRAANRQVNVTYDRTEILGVRPKSGAIRYGTVVLQSGEDPGLRASGW